MNQFNILYKLDIKSQYIILIHTYDLVFRNRKQFGHFSVIQITLFLEGLRLCLSYQNLYEFDLFFIFFDIRKKEKKYIFFSSKIFSSCPWRLSV